MYNRWTDKELAILEEYYPLGGYFLCKEKGLERRRDATLKKAQSLGLKVNDYNHLKIMPKVLWEEWELDILKENYVKVGKLGMTKLLPHRTEGAIFLKADSLGLHEKEIDIASKWSDEELDILKKYYSEYGPYGCKERGIDRTHCSIVKKANKLGLKMTDDAKFDLFCTKVRGVRKKYLQWTDEEISILKNNFIEIGAKGCKEKGLNREISSIYRKARELGLIKNKKRGVKYE